MFLHGGLVDVLEIVECSPDLCLPRPDVFLGGANIRAKVLEVLLTVSDKPSLVAILTFSLISLMLKLMTSVFLALSHRPIFLHSPCMLSSKVCVFSPDTSAMSSAKSKSVWTAGPTLPFFLGMILNLLSFQ